MPIDPNTFPSDAVRRLEAIMAALRGPDGCPWDREQNHRTLRANLLEEAYEVLAVLDEPGDLDDDRLVEELGDLLLQVVFHAQLASERGIFDLDRVADAISDKLVRRHPHVFGDREVLDSSEVLRNWEELKREENMGSAIHGVPPALPALLRASRMLAKAERAGFLWISEEEARAKVAEELSELQAATDPQEKTHELGDLLLALVSYAHFLGVEPESALREAQDRFDQRFRRLEERLESEGRSMGDTAAEELLAYWSGTTSGTTGGTDQAGEEEEGKSSAS
jgi:tetrapyrrole methylase family protein/MazG family protein